MCDLKSHATQGDQSVGDLDLWKCPNGMVVPDFIISGAMKCGTSTVHSILNQHAQVFIPDREINFFDIDEFVEHPDFNYFCKKWIWPNISDAPLQYWSWYQDFFIAASPDQMIGEDSTCYLPSTKAFSRIAIQEKPVKIIICLRDPTARTYSQYWHMLRTGRAIFSFEDTLRFEPSGIISRSLYRDQIKRCLSNIPRKRIFFFVLEQYLADKCTVLSRLTEFLGLNKNGFPMDIEDTHANVAKLPRYSTLETFVNRFARSAGNSHYLDQMPYETPDRKLEAIFSRSLKKAHRIINPLVVKKTPSMKIATKNFLDNFFRRELIGLDDLIGIDLSRYWFLDHQVKE